MTDVSDEGDPLARGDDLWVMPVGSISSFTWGDGTSKDGTSEITCVLAAGDFGSSSPLSLLFHLGNCISEIAGHENLGITNRFLKDGIIPASCHTQPVKDLRRAVAKVAEFSLGKETT